LPLEPGFARFRVTPQPVDLAYARGVFPTVRGDIAVSWKREQEAIELEVAVPDGTEAIIEAPGDRRAQGADRLGAGRHAVKWLQRRI
jgi:alpha-L-rhamnosidase